MFCQCMHIIGLTRATKLQLKMQHCCTWPCNSTSECSRGLTVQHVCRAAQKGSSRYQTHRLLKQVPTAHTPLRGLCLPSAMGSLMLRYSLPVCACSCIACMLVAHWSSVSAMHTKQCVQISSLHRVACSVPASTVHCKAS